MESFDFTPLPGHKRHPPALEERIFRPKKPALRFFCPLCRTERSFNYRSNLVTKNYVQVALISLILILIFYPFMGLGSLLWPIMVWMIFEASLKLLYRKEIPCPHCGFDATWYKRDVRIARKLVKNFWEHKENSSPKASTLEEN